MNLKWFQPSLIYSIMVNLNVVLMQFNLVNNEEQALYLWALFFSIVLRFSVTVRFRCCGASYGCSSFLVLRCVLA